MTATTITPDHCTPITAKSLSPYIALAALQCAALHPTFAHSRLARWVRMGVMPLNFFWWITLPFRVCTEATDFPGFAAIFVGLSGIYVAAKSLEWGFAEGSYYKRPLKTVNGVQQWDKIKSNDDCDKKVQENQPCNALQLLAWILLQMLSARGLQFTYGPATTANNQSTMHLIWKLCRVNIPTTVALSVIVLVSNSALRTPTSAFMSIGVPNFPGMSLLAESIYTICFGVWIASSAESGYIVVTLLASIVHKLASWFKCSEDILDLCNPLYFPPMFNSPHKSTSLAEFWSKRWHSALQRCFLYGGGKPMVWITKKIGASSKEQRLAGLFGIYAASAFLHEYNALVISRLLGQPRRSILSTFPGSAFFFMIQPFGILLEPYLIPLIPRKIGGGMLWVWTFLILTAYPFRVQSIQGIPVEKFFRPFSEWSWMYILSPMK